MGCALAGMDTCWVEVERCEGSGVFGIVAYSLGAGGIGGGSFPQSPLIAGLSVAAGTGDPGVAARALACVADVLGCWAEGRGGLRSGPAANPDWIRPFSYLESGDLARGVEALAQERDKWLSRWALMKSELMGKHLVTLGGGNVERGGAVTAGSQVPKPRQSSPSLGLCATIPPFLLGRPALLVRAARHYEGAGQILIRQAVMSAQHFVCSEPVELPAPGQWVVAECPARVDFSGEPLVGVGVSIAPPGLLRQPP